MEAHEPVAWVILVGTKVCAAALCITLHRQPADPAPILAQVDIRDEDSGVSTEEVRRTRHVHDCGRE